MGEKSSLMSKEEGEQILWFLQLLEPRILKLQYISECFGILEYTTPFRKRKERWQC